MKKIFILLMFLLLTGCVKVGIAGDSITYLSQDEITKSLNDNFYQVTLESYPGADTKEITAMVEDELRKDTQDRFIVNSGTNDVQRNIATWQSDYDNLVGVLGNASCVIFVTINPAVDSMGDGTVTSSDINSYLEGIISQHISFGLIDWAKAVAEDQTLLNPNEPIHPSKKGSEWLANAYVETMNNICPAD